MQVGNDPRTDVESDDQFRMIVGDAGRQFAHPPKVVFSIFIDGFPYLCEQRGLLLKMAGQSLDGAERLED